MQEGRDDAPGLFNEINAHIDKGTQLLRRLARLPDISALLGQDMTAEMVKSAWQEGLTLATVLSDGQCRLQYLYDSTHQSDPNEFDPSEYSESDRPDNGSL